MLVSGFSRLEIMRPSVRPIERAFGSHEWNRKVLCFPRNLVASELHDAHGVGRLAVICQDEFGDPKIIAANARRESSKQKLGKCTIGRYYRLSGQNVTSLLKALEEEKNRDLGGRQQGAEIHGATNPGFLSSNCSSTLVCPTWR
jgi:hypothetical protein